MNNTQPQNAAAEILRRMEDGRIVENVDMHAHIYIHTYMVHTRRTYQQEE